MRYVMRSVFFTAAAAATALLMSLPPASARAGGEATTRGADAAGLADPVPREHFVGNGGDDDNPGTRELPFRTIQRAVDVALPGDAVVILDGVYGGPGNIDVKWTDRGLTIRSDSNDRSRCVIDCAGAAGFSFVDAVAGDSDSLSFSGLAITNASAAITVTGGEPWHGFPPVRVAVARCAITDGGRGLDLAYADLDLRTTSVCGNLDTGVRTMGAFHDVVIDSCTISANAFGLEAWDWNSLRMELTATDFLKNGTGIRYVQDVGQTRLSHCRVDSSTTGSGIWAAGFALALELADCSASGNARSGVSYSEESMSATLTATRCDFSGNGLHGVAQTGGYVGLDLDDVTLADNRGWGIGPLVRDPAAGAFPGIPSHGSQPKELDGYVRIRHCELRANDLGGAQIRGQFHVIECDSTSLVGNGGPGLHVETSVPGVACDLTNVTIAGNSGRGISADAAQWSATRTLVALNGGAAVDLLDGSNVALQCCDLYGNLGGDWTPPLAPQLGVNGNLNLDPRFCDADNDDYHLRQDSPLSAGNNSECGTIGAYEWNCPAQPLPLFKPTLRDVPGDQGGRLYVWWPRHASDDAVNGGVTGYSLQRWGDGWRTIGSLAATAADTYATTIETPDVMTLGRSVPYAQYRLLATTADSSVFYVSAPDSGYSLDNLPPPKPQAVLVESLDYRYVAWIDPGVTDLESACVFRGEEAGFVPGAPLDCPAAGFYTETHLAWYFYRVQFVDIHGNLSEFSDELHGQWPTPVSGALPPALKLYPCEPNPFNPRTTVRFDVPDAGPVRLAVFDLAGRRVRTLVDESRPQGSHEVVWDGRDSSGREVASGTYLARLAFGGRVETVRMVLVR